MTSTSWLQIDPSQATCKDDLRSAYDKSNQGVPGHTPLEDEDEWQAAWKKQPPGTPNNQFLMDVWWNNHFLCKDLESSNWNNHL